MQNIFVYVPLYTAFEETVETGCVLLWDRWDVGVVVTARRGGSQKEGGLNGFLAGGPKFEVTPLVILPKTRVHVLHFAADSICTYSANFRTVSSKGRSRQPVRCRAQDTF